MAAVLTHVPAALDEVNHLKQSRKDKDAQAAKAREQVCVFLASPQCGLFAGLRTLALSRDQLDAVLEENSLTTTEAALRHFNSCYVAFGSAG